jgi:DDE_Tnp_1-associated
MSLTILLPPEKSRLRALLDHFSVIEDPREPWRVAHPVAEVLLLVVCGMIADCDDYEGIAEWGKAHFLRCLLSYAALPSPAMKSRRRIRHASSRFNSSPYPGRGCMGTGYVEGCRWFGESK